MRRWGSEEGAAYVEFLLAFVPILTLFLGLVQIGLLYAGNLVVQHAAHRAVRSAMVVLDDDPRYYEGEPRLVIDGRSATADELAEQLARRDDASSPPRRRTLSRRAAIELAAMTVIASIEPRDGDSIADALGTPDLAMRADAVRAATTIDVRVHRPSADTVPPEVRVRITHGFACRVPVVRRLICTSGRRPIEADDWGTLHVGDMDYGEGDWGTP
ncbi:TadE/TadG family type IV pilus assembly protein [Sandaracinus amylolyticus]|uniref:TadE/TadG family type IV pilus assembly protein n=1 Tax=Sandaracinus amylolyticus TaxID=927083 RepID=UPI001F1EA2C0|nr:TadE family protein [Sandaracinus amylolyticus]UJR79091.1 Hypothetical protein I5071_11240 [Sandaracinus amylolyticus]